MTTYILPNLTTEQYNIVVKHSSRWGQEFMASVLEQFRRKGSLSEKQGAMLDKLTAEALAKAAGGMRPDRKPEPATPVFAKITEMFDKAAEQLKRPRVVFASDAGEFLVRRAGDESRNPGHLYVILGGEYAGKIDPKGRFFAARECPAGVVQSLTAFNENPQKAATAYGQETGNCCFCARELTDPRSVTVGYGPICAGHFGLPWGL
jgi:Family of unknown function (DUF6011)